MKEISDTGQKGGKWLFSVFTAVLVLFGRAVYENNSVKNLILPFFSAVKTLMALVILSAFLYWLYSLLIFLFSKYERLLRQNTVGAMHSGSYKYERFYVFLILFLLSVGVLLAYYPGIFSYDMIIQTDQALGLTQIDRFQSAFHTFLWKGCIAFGKILTGSSGDKDTKLVIERAITVYGILQSFLQAYVLSGVIMTVRKINSYPWIKTLLTCLIILNPVAMIFSVIPAKDALFASFFVQMSQRIYGLIKGKNQRKEKKEHIFLSIDCILCCLLRNNAVYMVVLMVLALLVSRRKKQLRILTSLAAAVSLYLLINGPIYSFLGVAGGDVREALSLPLQQIAHTYVSESASIPENLREEIDFFLPTDEVNSVFNPRFADPVKKLARKAEITERFTGFLKLYFTLWAKYPDNYFNEAMALHVSAWYPFAEGVDAFSKRIYIETYIADYPYAQPERQSLFPAGLSLLEKVADYSAFGSIPGVRYLFSTAAPIWVIFFCVFILYNTERKEEIKICLPPLFLWMTYLAGPVTCMRYVYPIILVLPIGLAAVFDAQKGDYV